MSPIGPDFHLVQLTDGGKALAAGAPLRISNGRISVLFLPDEFMPGEYEAVKVARYEWDMLLRDHAHVDGSKLCEILVNDQPELLIESADNFFEDQNSHDEENE